MEYKDLSEKIIELKNADLEFRDQLIERGQLGEGYPEEIARLHNRNAEILNEIIGKSAIPQLTKLATKPLKQPG